MKKLISSLLVVILLISAVPFSNTAKTVLGTTEASAKEMIDGSFDYLTDYILEYGKYDDSLGGFALSEELSSGISGVNGNYSLVFNNKKQSIDFHSTTSAGIEGLACTIGSIISIRKDSDQCNTEVYFNSDLFDADAVGKINSQRYNKEDINFTFTFSDGTLYSGKEEFNKEFNKVLVSSVELFDACLKKNAGITLGNFGFILISDPVALPQIDEPDAKRSDFTLTYKQSAKVRPGISINNPSVERVEYSTSDSSVVLVDEKGNVTTQGPGSAKITCMVVDKEGNKYTNVYTVTVELTFIQWIIWFFLLGFLWY